MRKFWGITLLILGWLVALMTIMSGIPLLIKAIITYSGDAYGIGYLIGSFVFHVIFGFISYWIIKKGLQLTKKKKTDDQMDKIMSIK
jgi:hypothetical protein